MADIINIPNGTVQDSPYNGFPVYQDDANNIYLGLEAFPVLDLGDASEYVVQPGEEHRYDVIAFKVLNTPGYFWAILMANKIRNPLDGIPAGTKIQIPSRTSILKFLSTAKSFPGAR